MGVTAAMYAWGMEYEDPNNPYSMDGYFNSAAAAEAVEFYKKMYDDCAPPGHSDAYMVANLDAYKSGQVAFQMNWYAFWPGVAKEDSDGRSQDSLLTLVKMYVLLLLVVKVSLL